MRKGKSDIPLRAPSGAKQVRIPLKQKTAENIMQLNVAVAEAQARLQNHVLPLLTERGIMNGQVIRVTEKPPYELVVLVPK